MPAPTEFRILQNLQNALKAITTGGGYHYSVAANAVKLDLNAGVEALVSPDGPRPFIVIELGAERWKYDESGQQVGLVLPWTVYWVHDSDPTQDDSLLETYYRGCADVERAVAIDVNRGGLAQATRVVDRTLDRRVGGSEVWAVVDGECWLRRTFGQPDS